MKKHIFMTSKFALLSSGVLFFTVLYFVWAPFSLISFIKEVWAVSAVVTIDNTAYPVNTKFDGTGYTLVFVSDQVGYAFYLDSTSECVYRKTSDGGETWGSSVSTLGAQTDCLHTIVWYDQWTPGDTSGTNIHIVNSDIGDKHLWYTRLDTESDTLSTPVSITPATEGGSLYSSRPYAAITKGTNGQLYVGMHTNGSDADDSSYIVTCASSCTDSANWDYAGTSPLEKNQDVDELVLLPLASADILVVRRDKSANHIDSKVYTHGTGTWDPSWTDIDTSCEDSAIFEGAHAATVNRSTNDVYLAYVCSGSANTGDVRTALYSSGSWATTAELVSDAYRVRDTSIAVDENTGNVYVAYTQEISSTPNKQDLYVASSTDSMTSWGTAVGPIDTTVDVIRNPSMNAMSNERIGLMWYQEAPDDMFYATVADLVPSVNTIPTASIGVPIQTSASAVTVTSTIADTDQDVTILTVQYSLDNASWSSATLGAVSASDGTVTTSTGSISSIDTDTDGSVDLSIVWDIAADVPNTYDSSVYIRITPNDGTGDGSTQVSDAFEVDTAKPIAPGNLSVSTTSTDGVVLLFGSQSVDAHFSEYKIFYKAGASGVSESDAAFTSSSDANLGSISYGGASTTTISGLSAATQYVATIFAYDSYGYGNGASSEVAFYTLANVPGAPTAVAVSTSSLSLTLETASNLASVEYSICQTTNGISCASGGYVQANGTLGASAVWATSSAWGAGGTIVVTDLAVNTGYQFLAMARNGDGVVTDPSTASTLRYTHANPALMPTLLNATTSTLSMTLNTNSNPASTTYALYNDTDGIYIDEDGTATTTAIFQTATTWGTTVVSGLTKSTSYSFSVLAQNHDNAVTATSSIATLATLAETPGNPIVNTPTVSTLDVQISSSVENGNGAGTTYAVYNVTSGAYVDSDGSSTGSAVWQTAATWSTVTVTGLSSNTSYTFRVKAKNPDDVETDLSDPTAAYTATGDPSNFQAIIISTSTITFTLDAFSNDSVGSSGYCFYISDCDSGSGWLTTSTWQASSLNLNTQYAFYAQYRNADGVESSPTELLVYTKATSPDAPIVEPTSSSTIAITIVTSGNSTSTEYAIYNTVLGSYLDTTGASTSTAVWQTTSTWANITASGLSPNTAYGFKIKARNGDASETDFGNTATVYTDPAVPGTPTTVASSATTLSVSWNDASNGTGTVYELYNVTSAALVATTTETSLSVTGLSSNTASTFKVRAQYLEDNSTWTSYSSNSSGVYTLASVPTAPTVSNQTTNTIDIDMSNIANGNASATTYALYNVTASAYIDAGGASSSSAVYQTTSSWAGITAIGLTPNTSYTFQVKAKNSDEVDTDFGTASSESYTSPATAGQPTFANVTASSLDISFSDNANASGTVYTLYNNTSGEVATSTTDTSSIPLSGLTPNTTYEFAIISNHAGGGADAATSTPASTTTLASVPTSLSTTAVSVSRIDLSWSSANASGSVYSIHYTDGTFIATTTATSYSVTGLSENTSYTFKVRTEQVGSSGTYSDYSATASASTPLGLPTPATGLTFSSVGTSTLALSWTDNATNEESYTVEYGTDGVNFDVTVTTTVANVTSTSVTGLTPNTHYYFTVSANNSSGIETSDVSSTATIATAPTGLSASAISTSQIDLSWNTTNASSSLYDVRFADGTFIATTTASSYSVTGLSQNTSYTFKVRTEQTGSSGTYSAYSDTVTTSTLVGVLNAPTGLTASSVATTTLTLSWTDASSNEDAFVVNYGTDGSTYPTTVTTTAAGVDTTAVTELTPNTQYYFIVVASNTSGSATSTATNTTTLAATPSALSASAVSTSQINLSWSSTNPSDTVYEIRNTSDVLIATTTVTSYSVTGLDENTTYAYKVRAQQTGDANWYSGYSNTATATTSLDIPDAPTDLTISAVASTSFTLSWTDASSNETSFVVKYGTDNSTFGTTVTTTASGVTSTAVTGLTPNTPYYAIVIATNGSGTGTSASATTTTIPVAPSSISASASSASSITVTWVDNTNASGSTYQLSYSDGTVIGTTSNKTYAVTGLSASTTYAFKVRTRYANNVTSYTGYTSTASATTQAESSVTPTPTTTSQSGGASSPAPPVAKGGGGSSQSIPMFETKQVTLDHTGLNTFMYIGSGAEFTVRPSSRTLYETHRVSIVELDLFTNVVTVEVASQYPARFDLHLSEAKEVDIDDDDMPDLRVVFAGLDVNRVELTLIPLSKTSLLSCPLPLNHPYKSPSSPAVYYVSEAHHTDGSVDTTLPCAKRPFTTSQKFFTYFTNWNQVVSTKETLLNSIPLDTLGFMPEGPLYDPQYGALVKIVADPKVYLLLGGNKYWITSETVFTGLRYSWSWIEGVADELLDKYTTKEEITYTDHHPSYTLVKYQSSPKVYRLEPHPTDTTKQVKRHITDEATFNALNFRWDRIVTIDESEVYETGSPLTTPSKTTTSALTNTTSTQQPQASFTSFLSLGSAGPEVLLLQQTLQSLGFFPTTITPNGTFGPTTETAVKAFQTAHHIDPLGYVGPATREVLNGAV